MEHFMELFVAVILKVVLPLINVIKVIDGQIKAPTPLSKDTGAHLSAATLARDDV